MERNAPKARIIIPITFTPTKNVPSKPIIRNIGTPLISTIYPITPRVTFRTPTVERENIIFSVPRSLSAYITETKETDEEPDDAEELGASTRLGLDYGEDEEVVFSRDFRDQPEDDEGLQDTTSRVMVPMSENNNNNNIQSNMASSGHEV